MRAAFALLALPVIGLVVQAADPVRQAPSYSQSSIVNAASNLPGPLAPNTIGSLYGSDLAFVTRELRPEDIRDGSLPTLLSGTGVRVVVSRWPAQIFFVSPRQINFLVPANLRPGQGDLQLVVDGRAGPLAPLRLDRAAPGLFELPGGFAVAIHGDGRIVSPESPASPGDVIVLFATGLGETAPPALYGEVARGPARLAPGVALDLEWDGRAAPPEDLLYAGLSPGFAGLYQINCRVPGFLAQGSGPASLRVRLDAASSQPDVKVSIRRQ